MILWAVWEKYKHMDEVLSEGQSGSYSFRSQIISELWAALKEALKEEEGG